MTESSIEEFVARFDERLNMGIPTHSIKDMRLLIASWRERGEALKDVRDYVASAARDPANTVAIRRLAKLDEAINPLLEARELYAKDQQRS